MSLTKLGSGLFMEYPLITRKVLASQTVGFLLQDNVEFIQHANYIHTAMEGIGQGFALPLTVLEFTSWKVN